MKTIISFINFLGSLFNLALSICLFTMVDDLSIVPEKSFALYETLKRYFPIELCITNFIFITALFYRNYLQIILFFPIFVRNIITFVKQKHKIYTGIGENPIEIKKLSLNLKIKFIYYLILFIFNTIKFITSTKNMVSYKVWGDTNFFMNVVRLIGIY